MQLFARQSILRAVLVVFATHSAVQALADQRMDTITVAAPWKIGAATAVSSGAVLQRMGVTEPLTQPDRSGNIEGLLAAGWSADEALTTWRFQIRQGVLFHDGTPLTAQAVAQNLETFAAESALRKAPLQSISSDGDEVVITLSRPFAPLPAYLAHWSTGILSPGVLKGNEASAPVGTGFYRVVDQEGNLALTLEAFSEYWGEKPAIGQARYVFAPEDATRLAMVRAGEAELAFGLKANLLDPAESGDGYAIRTEATPRVRALKLNAGSPPFSDLKIRQAVSLAIDRQAIAATLLANPKTAATQLIPPAVSAWYQPQLEPFGHDPKRAIALLRDQGWTRGRDGTFQKEGESLRVEFLVYDARPELPEIATAVQAQLAEVGIRADIVNVDWTAIPARHEDNTLEMAIISDGFAYIPEPIGALAENYTKGGAAWGAMGWRNDQFGALVEEYQATVDPDLQSGLRKRMMEILHDELPVITITWYDETFAVSSAIGGFVFDPFEMRYGLNKVKWSP